MDLAVSASAICAFFVFFVLHVIFLRRMTATFKAILASVAVAGVFHAILFTLLWISHPSRGVLTEFLGYGVLAFILYGLLVFHYIAWVFGMGEAAIRIRLLDELDRSAGGSASWEEIYRRYNVEMIYETRLARLLNAGHIVREGMRYRTRSPLLLIQSSIAKSIKTLLGIGP